MAVAGSIQNAETPGVAAFVTHDEVYDHGGSWEELHELLSRLPLDDLLQSLSTLNVMLFTANATDSEIQRALVQELVVPPTRERVLRLLSEPGAVAFYDEQILSLMKWATLVAKKTKKLNVEKAWDEVIEALFLVSELLGRQQMPKQDEEGDLVMMAVRSFYFNATDYPRSALTRSYDLWLLRTSRERHRASVNYVDIPQLFRKATGVDLQDYLAAGMALLAHFARFRSPSDLAKVPFAVTWDALKVHLGHREAEKRFLNAVSRSPNKLKVAFQSHAGGPGLGAPALLPFYESPLIRLGSGRIVPASPQLLLDRLTAGVYWTLHRYIRDTCENKELLRFTRFVGELFEDQVCDVLARCYPTAPGMARRFFREAEIGAHVGAPDAVIVYGDALIFIEVSSARMRYRETIFEGRVQAFDEDIDKCIVHNARQLHRRVQDFRAGRLVIPDVNPAVPHRVFPVILLMDPFPEYPHIWSRVQRRLDTEGYLSTTEPLQLLSARDLEMLECLLWRGQTLRDLLAAKNANPTYTRVPMRTHLLHQYPGQQWVSPRTAEVYGRLKTLVADRLTFEAEP